MCGFQASHNSATAWFIRELLHKKKKIKTYNKIFITHTLIVHSVISTVFKKKLNVYFVAPIDGL